MTHHPRGIRKAPWLAFTLTTLAAVPCFGALAGATENPAPQKASRRAGAALDAESITGTVRDELLFDDEVRMRAIHVNTSDGIVTLSGTVESLYAKRRAARLAESVRGVLAVVNRIEVLPLDEDRSDDRIASDLRDALIADPVTERRELMVEVEDGIVTMRGRVDSRQEATLALDVARRVRGVRQVVDALEVLPRRAARHEEIRAEVEAALERSIFVDPGLIDVAVRGGRVRLSGVVGSASEKRRAADIAWIPGVRDVDASALEVVPALDDGPRARRASVRPPDHILRDTVAVALSQDPRLYSLELDLTVSDGEVILRGEVDTLSARRAAGQVARNTFGVDRVSNRLLVRPPSPVEDASIESNIDEALERDPYLNQRDIRVEVDDGVTTLRGSVESYLEKVRADRAASRVTGVLRLRNLLEVGRRRSGPVYDPYVDDWSLYGYEWFEYEPADPLATDEEIRAGILEQLSWSPAAGADDVHVEVNRGVATLSGTVDGRVEWRSVMENAFEGGAVHVRDELVIEETSRDGSRSDAGPE